MVAGYQLLPTTDIDQDGYAERGDVGLRGRGRAWLHGTWELVQTHADALDAGWLADLERLGGPVFACFMLLRCTFLSHQTIYHLSYLQFYL